MQTTCKDCPDRYPGCHDHCPKYLEQKAKNEEYKKQVKHAMRVDSEFISIRSKQKTRTIRKKQQEGK